MDRLPLFYPHFTSLRVQVITVETVLDGGPRRTDSCVLLQAYRVAQLVCITVILTTVLYYRHIV